MKKRKLIFISITTLIISVIAIFSGLLAGTSISNKYFKIDKYASLLASDYEDDFSKINYKNKIPTQLTPTEVFLVAVHLLEASDIYLKDNMGAITTSVGVDQTVHSITMRDGELYTQKYCSTSSLVRLAGFSQFKYGEDIHLQEGTPTGKTLDTVEWSDNYQHYTYEEYTKRLGRDPIDECGYIVSSKTVTESTLLEQSNNIYTFKLVLDPFYSTISYVNEVSYMAGTEKDGISFNSLEIEFSVDQNYKFIKQTSHENFSMKYSNIPVTVDAIYEANFTY